MTLMTELPETGLDVIWLKDNVPLSMAEGKYEIMNQNTSYQLLISDARVEDGGKYTVEGGEYESTVSLSINGWFSYHSSFKSLTFLICLTLAEQYTKEQSQVVTVLEEASDLDTNVLQSGEEACQSKDSISLLLVEETSELLVHDFVPEEVTLSVIIEGDRKIEGKKEAEERKKFTAGKTCLRFS